MALYEMFRIMTRLWSNIAPSYFNSCWNKNISLPKM